MDYNELEAGHFKALQLLRRRIFGSDSFLALKRMPPNARPKAPARQKLAQLLSEITRLIRSAHKSSSLASPWSGDRPWPENVKDVRVSFRTNGAGKDHPSAVRETRLTWYRRMINERPRWVSDLIIEVSSGNRHLQVLNNRNYCEIHFLRLLVTRCRRSNA